MLFKVKKYKKQKYKFLHTRIFKKHKKMVVEQNIIMICILNKKIKTKNKSK